MEDCYKVVGDKKLRFGYTTGSCAAAAAKAAAWMLLSGKQADHIRLETPKGVVLHLKVLDIRREEGSVSCAIEKDAGDDPDITNGVWVYAKVSYLCTGRLPSIQITGGDGIGTVTRPGLDQPPGACAINSVPRQMISLELQELCRTYGCTKGLQVELSVPQGRRLAEKTFNPRLGIVGGISILGTTGIVEPMSESALVSSIRLELNQKVQLGRKSVLVTPGNYGQEYVRQFLPFPLEHAVKCSNFVGETIDLAVGLGIETILFVSHIGKFIKVAGGIFQTHSRNADARLEILTANAALAGAGQPLLSRIMESVTTEEAICLLDEAGLLKGPMEHVMKRIQSHLERRCYGRAEIAAIVFSNELGKRKGGSGELGRTANATEAIQKIQEG